MTPDREESSPAADMEHPNPRADDSFLGSMGSEMVVLIVGQSEMPFGVHKKLLCDRIPYFKTIFAEGSVASLENRATFPEEDLKTFDILMSWVYDDELPILRATFQETYTGINFPSTWNPEALYCLAEKLGLSHLADRIMVYIEKWHYDLCVGFSKEKILFVYENTSQGSPLRKYVTRWLYWEVGRREYCKRNVITNSDFVSLMKVEDIFDEFYVQSKKPRCPWHHAICLFHKHGKSPCLAKDYQAKTRVPFYTHDG